MPTPLPIIRTVTTALGALFVATSMTVQAETVLRTVPSSDLKVLDPIWTTALITRNHGFMIYDTLFGSDEKGNIRPQMVDKYSVSKDSLVWTFTLRPGLKFSDGSPVTSDDVIASLNRWGKRDVLGQKMYAAMESLTPQGRVSWLPNLQATYGFGATWPKQMSQSYCKAEVPTAKSSA